LVHLDPWVWILLARAMKGRPDEPGGAEVLGEVRQASAAGVVFPNATPEWPCPVSRAGRLGQWL